MKYCVYYKPGFRYAKEVDELIITYNRRDTSLQDFLREHPDQRILIYVADPQDFWDNKCQNYFFAMQKQGNFPKFALVFPKYDGGITKKIIEALITDEVKIPYFFELPATSWDTLQGYLDLGVSDVYIAEELGFSMAAVSRVCKERGCQVRCYPNVAQSSWTGTPAMKKFFIRPEDVKRYEEYVDVLEIWGRSESLETMYRIYAKDQRWAGPLKELITSFDPSIDVNNACIDHWFAMRRMSCDKRCNKGYYCDTCNAIVKLANVLEQYNVIVKD